MFVMLWINDCFDLFKIGYGLGREDLYVWFIFVDRLVCCFLGEVLIGGRGVG